MIFYLTLRNFFLVLPLANPSFVLIAGDFKVGTSEERRAL